jgi:hypothetical protein
MMFAQSSLIGVGNTHLWNINLAMFIMLEELCM